MNVWQAVMIKRDEAASEFRQVRANSAKEVARLMVKLQFKGWDIFKEPKPIGQAAKL